MNFVYIKKKKVQIFIKFVQSVKFRWERWKILRDN